MFVCNLVSSASFLFWKYGNILSDFHQREEALGMRLVCQYIYEKILSKSHNLFTYGKTILYTIRHIMSANFDRGTKKNCLIKKVLNVTIITCGLCFWYIYFFLYAIMTTFRRYLSFQYFDCAVLCIITLVTGLWSNWNHG